MGAVDPLKYQALAELVGPRSDGALIDRRSGRKLPEVDGQCSILRGNGRPVTFSARAMRQHLADAGISPKVGRPPSRKKYRGLLPLFRMDAGVLVRAGNGKPPALRRDGQCRIMVDGKAIAFSPAVVADMLTRREERDAAFESAAKPWFASLDQRYNFGL